MRKKERRGRPGKTWAKLLIILLIENNRAVEHGTDKIILTFDYS